MSDELNVDEQDWEIIEKQEINNLRSKIQSDSTSMLSSESDGNFSESADSDSSSHFISHFVRIKI